jgi:hypothetical protein
VTVLNLGDDGISAANLLRQKPLAVAASCAQDADLVTEVHSDTFDDNFAL